MGKLPHRFLENIFPIRRYYEDEEIEFPLEGVPDDLRTYILEKITYPDFINLNSCNTLTSQMCHSLSSTVRLPLVVEYILCADYIFGEDGSQDGSQAIQNNLPKNIDYYCDLFRIQPQYWDIIKDYNIEAEILDIHCRDYTEEFLKNLLEFTNATKLQVREITLPILELPEVAELDFIEFFCPDLTDDDFLKLRQPSIIADDFEPSFECFHKFITEWFEGEREIMECLLKFDEFMWKFRSEHLRSEFPFAQEEEQTEYHHPFWICRSDDHSDCIKLSHDYDEILSIEGDEPCPKAENSDSEESNE